MWTAEGKHLDAARCLLKWGASVQILDKVSMRLYSLALMFITLSYTVTTQFSLL